jgi:hypothetical protein
MDLHANVTEYFHEVVTSALRETEVRATASTEFYLVNLLTEFTAAPVGDEPLALKLARVQETAAPEGKAQGLKEIGDESLVVTGLFSDSLQRKLVAPDYYISMGASAYRQLASLVSATRTSAASFFSSVYEELAAKFGRFVAVLQEIRRHTNLHGGGPNLLRMYEAYVRSGGAWLESRLRAAGLILPVGLTGAAN